MGFGTVGSSWFGKVLGGFNYGQINHTLRQVIFIKQIVLGPEFVPKEDKEKESVYKKQIESYSAFVKKLVSGNSILSRRFYIILPYHHPDSHEDWKVIKEHLNLNRDIVMKGLERMQMKARELTSLEILNLFYTFYNPESVKTQAITKETLSVLFKHNYV